MIGRSLALFLLILTTSFATTASAKPNVVFILADDLGWVDSEPYGSRFYQTPELSRLASTGLRFSDAYAANPLCSPTRASILTGQDPGRLRFTTPGGHLDREQLDAQMAKSGPPNHPATNGESNTRLPNDTFTLGELFKQAGYRTAFMGKWHLGREPYIPEAHGFGRVVGGRENPGPPPPGHFFAPWNIDTIDPHPAGTHVSDVVTTEALDFITNADDADEPFFLCLWYYDVHAPYQGKDELISKYEARADPDDPQHQPVMGAMIETMDTNLGRLLDLLEKRGLADDTVIVFFSDNGGNMYDRINGDPPTSNAPLRGGKAMSYEGGIRVPLIVRWPGVTDAGEVSNALVSSVDFFPTFVEGLNLDAPNDLPLDGVSLMSALRGEAFDRGPIFTHFPHYIGNRNVDYLLNRPSTTVRVGDWKLYRYYADGPRQADRYELYDLSEDIGETNDLAFGQPDRVIAMDRLIEGYLARTGALRPVANPAYRPDAAGPPSRRPRAPAPGGMADPPDAGPVAGWEPSPNGFTALSLADGRLVVTSTGIDPFVVTQDVPGASGDLTLVLTMASDSDGPGDLFWSDDKPRGFGKDNSATFTPTHDGKDHTYRVPFKVADPLVSLRLDPSRAEGTMRISNLHLEDAAGKTVKDWDFSGDGAGVGGGDGEAPEPQ